MRSRTVLSRYSDPSRAMVSKWPVTLASRSRVLMGPTYVEGKYKYSDMGQQHSFIAL